MFSEFSLKITARFLPGVGLRSLNNLFPGQVFKSGSGSRLGFLKRFRFPVPEKSYDFSQFRFMRFHFAIPVPVPNLS